MNASPKADCEPALRERVADAATRIYDVDSATPLESIELVSDDGQVSIAYLKREDLSRIRSYKWRGAYFKMIRCIESGNCGPFVTSSAGNHAQGVAMAAKRLGVSATIFMPLSTPVLKQRAVRKFGGEWVTIILSGDRFEETSAAASQCAAESGATIVPPFDDLDVIAGQATVACETIQQLPEVDVIFVPVGGGGLASGVSYACATQERKIRVVGVEVAGQDSMRLSINADCRESLDNVDRFCDGTAVAEPGKTNFELCRRFLDEIIVVTNEQVCAAIQSLWEDRRLITEPSGAIAFAGLTASLDAKTVDVNKQKCVAIISGGNTDFLTLPSIVQLSQLNQPTRRYYRFEIAEQNGSLIELLDRFLDEINIVDFQYGKTNKSDAAPVLGLSGRADQLIKLESQWNELGIDSKDVSQEQSVMFRVIPFRDDLVSHPLFLHIDFPDRPGAVRELMRNINAFTNICYFNYTDSGQMEGHALIGFEFEDPAFQTNLLTAIEEQGLPYREFKLNTSSFKTA